MGDDPSPPPVSGADDESAPEPEEDEEPETEERGGDPVYPFLDAAAIGTAEVEVRAGWAEGDEGEVVDLVYDYTGPAGAPATQEVYAGASEWYAGTLAQLNRAEGEGGE